MKISKHRQWLLNTVIQQKEWMKQCGGTLAGYIANYHTHHGRTIENAVEIYQADLDTLQKFEWRLERA